MYRIKTLNQISPVYEAILPADEYAVSAGAERADPILVRSADMHETQLDPETLCVGRAGAGVNNNRVRASLPRFQKIPGTTTYPNSTTDRRTTHTVPRGRKSGSSLSTSSRR